MKIQACIVAAGIALSGCVPTTTGTGALIGGATGAAVGAAATGTVGGTVVGGVVGAGVGAAIGAAAEPVPPNCIRYNMFGQPYRVC